MMRVIKNGFLALSALTLFSAMGFAQKYEVHPYLGAVVPSEWADVATLKTSAEFGVKAAVFADCTTQVEGEFGYMPHFEFRGTDPKTRAWIWGVSASRNVPLPHDTTFVPFFLFGVGGVTTRMENPDFVTTRVGFLRRPITIENNDTFFMFNYGGGVKALNLAGPVGLRFTVEGRTLPNFFGRQNTWFDGSAGVIFTWGEK